MEQAAVQTNRGRSNAAKEFHSGDVKIQQASPIILPDEPGMIDHDRPILPVDSPEGGAYADQLAFMEEPVTIRVQPSSDKNAPKFIECWVNGVGAELLDQTTGKWVAVGAFPVGRVVTTKRKYIEVLARSKVQTWDNNVIENNGQDPINQATSNTYSRAPFSVIEDKNPRGIDWLTKILSAEW